MSGGLELAEVGRRYRAVYPAATADAYERGWDAWVSWARDSGVCPFPAEPGDVADYLSGLRAEGRSAGTIKVRRAAIRAAHLTAGLDNPGRSQQVAAARVRSREAAEAAGRSRQVAADLGRSGPDGGAGQPAAVPPHAARRAAALAAAAGNHAGVRDAAILELLSAGWVRPGELLRLDWADLTAPPARGPAVAVVKVRAADGAETPSVIPPETWRRLRSWRLAAGGASAAGPMFTRLGASGSARLSGRDLRRIVSRRLEAAGVTRATPSGLRAGAAVAAFRQGRSLPYVQRKGRWSDPRQPAEYAAEAAADPAATAGPAAAGSPAGDAEAAADQTADQRSAGYAEPVAGLTADEATAAYVAAEADALAALDRLHKAREALQQAVGPQQAAEIADGNESRGTS